ncbi:hypothetical protein Hanom_Chr10g00923721 [Helianthus anomalus]
MLTKLLYKTFSKITLQKSKLLYYSNLIITLHFPKLLYKCSKLLYRCSELLYKTLFVFSPVLLKLLIITKMTPPLFVFFPRCLRFIH